MTDRRLFRRSRGALAVAGLVAMALASMMQGGGAQAAGLSAATGDRHAPARPIAERAAAR